jgi:hypothetical protein
LDKETVFHITRQFFSNTFHSIFFGQSQESDLKVFIAEDEDEDEQRLNV